MAIFLVFVQIPETGLAPADDDVVFVEDRFGWRQFFWGPFWLLAHRLWLASISIFALYVAILVAVACGLGVLNAGLILSLINLYIGFEGNSLYAGKLRRLGFTCNDLVCAPSVEAAEKRFFQMRSLGAPIPPEINTVPQGAFV